jgi:hypothetical protein
MQRSACRALRATIAGSTLLRHTTTKSAARPAVREVAKKTRGAVSGTTRVSKSKKDAGSTQSDAIASEGKVHAVESTETSTTKLNASGQAVHEAYAKTLAQGPIESTVSVKTKSASQHPAMANLLSKIVKSNVVVNQSTPKEVTVPIYGAPKKDPLPPAPATPKKDPLPPTPREYVRPPEPLIPQTKAVMKDTRPQPKKRTATDVPMMSSIINGISFTKQSTTTESLLLQSDITNVTRLIQKGLAQPALMRAEQTKARANVKEAKQQVVRDPLDRPRSQKHKRRQATKERRREKQKQQQQQHANDLVTTTSTTGVQNESKQKSHPTVVAGPSHNKNKSKQKSKPKSNELTQSLADLANEEFGSKEGAFSSLLQGIHQADSKDETEPSSGFFTVVSEKLELQKSKNDNVGGAAANTKSKGSSSKLPPVKRRNGRRGNSVNGSGEAPTRTSVERTKAKSAAGTTHYSNTETGDRFAESQSNVGGVLPSLVETKDIEAHLRMSEDDFGPSYNVDSIINGIIKDKTFSTVNVGVKDGLVKSFVTSSLTPRQETKEQLAVKEAKVEVVGPTLPTAPIKRPWWLSKETAWP